MTLSEEDINLINQYINSHPERFSQIIKEHNESIEGRSYTYKVLAESLYYQHILNLIRQDLGYSQEKIDENKYHLDQQTREYIHSKLINSNVCTIF